MEFDDRSNGWEAAAAQFLVDRPRRAVGASTAKRWAASLAPRSSVLDLGCGTGEPIARAFAEAGHELYGVDASPTMIAGFRERFPEAAAACEPVEESDFFGRTFDAIVAWGLLFLLPEAEQRRFFPRVAGALRPGGRLFFTSPVEPVEWRDVSTGRLSRSLGGATYRELLRASRFEVVAEEDDEGDNHSYAAILERRG
jgi:cyclopropane fatty-acyl-phospholipid synthase-like methyltransferase